MQPRPGQSRTTEPLHVAMLPLGVPVHPGLDVAASAVVQEDAAAGGDWFDTLPVDDGALALVAGDVVGNGASALAAAGQLRSAVLLAVSEDADPGRVLTRVARYAEVVPECAGASICLAVVRPASGAFRYAVAGYPPPFVVDRTGATTPQAPTGDGRLGCTTTYVSGAGVLRDDEVLLVASDGFQLPAGRDPLPPPAGDLDAWCAQLLHRVATAPGLVDDAVLLGVRRRPPLEPLELRYPALPDTVGVVRHEVAAWLRRAGVEPIDSSAVVQAVSELASNSVEHAYPAGTDHRRTEITVTAGLTTACVVELDLRDNGRWRPPEPVAGRGRGLPMSREFVDDLRIDTGASGTRCRLRHRPFGSTSVLSERRSGRAAAAGPPFALDVSDGHVGVRGAVGPSAADELRLVLGRVSAAGTRAATVDLAAVTSLCRAAVEAISSARTGARGEAPLQIVAGAGTTADRVLTWAGIPHQVHESGREGDH